MTGELVLVTGGSGFVGAHCILALLAEGYRVRTSVRSSTREPEVRELLRTGGVSSLSGRVSFAVADLRSDIGWDAAMQDCTYVLHVASPFPAAAPRHEDDLIVPAREGTLRMLRAARGAGVRRVVLTSSFAAIGYGHPPTDEPFTETDWTDVSARECSAYARSKTLAERAAWDFVAEHGDAPELAVVNPVAILGPVLGPDRSTSIGLVQRLLDGRIPGSPQLSYGIVDVRDVAELHVRAMTDPAAAGQRFLAIADEDFVSMHDIALILRAHFGDGAHRVPTRVLPNWLVRIAGRMDGSLGQLVPELGARKAASNAKATELLGWSPRSAEDAILATAESLGRLGLLRGA